METALITGADRWLRLACQSLIYNTSDDVGPGKNRSRGRLMVNSAPLSVFTATPMASRQGFTSGSDCSSCRRRGTSSRRLAERILGRLPSVATFGPR